MGIPTRDEAWSILTEFTESDALRKHALSVEAAMRAYATKLGGDPEVWGVTGLLHDFDYERYPSLEDHPFRGSEILAERGVDEEIRTAILGHGDHTGVPRETVMARSDGILSPLYCTTRLGASLLRAGHAFFTR